MPVLQASPNVALDMSSEFIGPLSGTRTQPSSGTIRVEDGGRFLEMRGDVTIGSFGWISGTVERIEIGWGSQTGAVITDTYVPGVYLDPFWIGSGDLPLWLTAHLFGADDTIVGSNRGDWLVGFAGDDRIEALGGDDNLRGNIGADHLIGGTGNDTLRGDDADETFASGFTGNDTLEGCEGNDLLEGGGHHDLLAGDEGDDTLDGAGGDDTLDGGTGRDAASYVFWSQTLFNASAVSAGRTVTIDDGNGGRDTLKGIEGLLIRGSASADTLTGSAGADTIDGWYGGDSLCGAGGNDLIRGSIGSETVDGGAGADIFVVGGRLAEFKLVDEGGVTKLVHTVNGGIQGPDILSDVERLRFDDREVTLAEMRSIVREELFLMSPDGSIAIWDQALGSDGFSWIIGGLGPENFAGVGDMTGDRKADVLLKFSENWYLCDITNLGSIEPVAVPIGATLLGIANTTGGVAEELILREADGDIVALDAMTGKSTYHITLSSDFSFAGTGNLFGATGTGAAVHEELLIRNVKTGQLLACHGGELWLVPMPANMLSWTVAATGNFTGSAHDDVLLFNPSSRAIHISDAQAGTSEWLFSLNSGWEIAATGDFTGDGRDDILFRHDSGYGVYWDGTMWHDAGDVLATARIIGVGDIM
ncbi:MAG TPA: calcium-binding protein [Azospirillaceae bacterium]|nr:calcium-binding protein [Azospirillaceae bacterium]